MTTRYFKGTDGIITVFRASKTKVYQSAWFSRDEGQTFPRGDQGFSGATVARHPYATKYGVAARTVTTTEIAKAEYDSLVKLKNTRFADPTQASPQDSWVPNAEIA